MPEYCLIKHRIENVTIDGADPDRNPDRIPATGTITFEPILQKGDSVTITENGKTTTLTLSPIEASITQGEIWHKGEPGIKIFAGGDDTNPERIRYKATFSNMQAGGKKIELKPILFEAIPGGELELSVAQPIPGAPYPGYSASIEQALGRISTELSRTLDHIDATAANVISDVRQQNSIPRIESLEALGGLSAESPVDGQTANLVSQPDTLTRSAVITAVESRLDGRFLPNDPTYSMVPRLVHHGTSPRTPRPSTDGPVIWLGIPMPVHSQPGDVLLRPAGSEADWTPYWLDLVGWYDPSTLTTGSAVTYVEDHSGHENHLDIPGGTGQITVDGSALAHPALYFDGESWISSGLLSQGQWTHPTTVWVVVSSISVAPGTATIFDSADIATGGDLRLSLSALFISDQGRFSSSAGINHFGTEPIPESTPTLLMVNFTGDSTSFGEINGQHAFGPLDLGAKSESDSHRLGANSSDENRFKGSVGEVIIAHGVTESDREATTSYLMEKWGIA